jgi:hypothetical protein
MLNSPLLKYLRQLLLVWPLLLAERFLHTTIPSLIAYFDAEKANCPASLVGGFCQEMATEVTAHQR